MAYSVGKLTQDIRRGVKFGAYGAAGCAIAWIVGELLFLAVAPSSTSTTSAARSLLFDQDFNRGLEQAGAHTGEVRISLKWQNKNDLDLHCIDPNQQRISFKLRRSQSGGELDVDRNASSPYKNEPVENIYWANGAAPLGRYRVFVNSYNARESTVPTAYKDGVAVRGEPKVFEGSVGPTEPNEVYSFDLAARAPQIESGWSALPLVAVWTAVVAGCLSVMLVIGQNRSLRRFWLSPREGLVAGVGGMLVGAASGALSQGAFGVVASGPFLTAVGKLVG